MGVAGETRVGETVTVDCIGRKVVSEEVTFKVSPVLTMFLTSVNLML